MSKSLLFAVALSAQVIVCPLLMASAQARSPDTASSTAMSPTTNLWDCQTAGSNGVGAGAGANAGAAPGTGISEGSISTNSAEADFVAGEQARRSGTDPGATGVAGVMPINIPSQAVNGIDPANGTTSEFRGGWSTTATANVYVGPTVYGTSTAAAPAFNPRAYRSVTDCLNMVSLAHAPLDSCER